MLVLGIDPGLNTSGYAVLEYVARQPRLVEAGVVRGKSGAHLAARVHEIHTGVAEVIASLKPEVLAIEELYAHYDRPTTAILMGHARGVILLTAAEAGIPVQSYRATQIKKTITGNGHAAKWQMQEAIRRELDLATVPEPPDVADALAIALCHCYLSRSNELRISDCGSRIEAGQSEIRNPKSEIRNTRP
jgi:crossover junction endodeoxyribonuclease RuvC